LPDEKGIRQQKIKKIRSLAAKNGEPRAQLLLSQMYEKGQEVTKDPKKAAYWKKKYEKNPAKK
jgi:TPR repeat protein